jgi:hypothetical protein
MFDAVKARIADVPGIAGRIEAAANLSELISRGLAPQGGDAAFILPLGIRGGAEQAMAGLFIQDIAETLGIVLFIRAVGDTTGARSNDRLTPIRNAVIRQIVGWSPPSEWLEGETVGQFRLSRGELISLSAGLLIYQIDFALTDQLRI